MLLYVQTTYLTEISKVIGFSYPHSCHFESKPSKGGQYIQCWNFTKFTFHVVKFKQVADIVPTWYHYEIDNLLEPHNQIHISCTISPFTVSLSICRGRQFELFVLYGKCLSQYTVLVFRLINGSDMEWNKIHDWGL